MTSMLRPAIVLFVLLSLVTGLAYPLAVTGVAQVAFPLQANGSLVVDDRGRVRGSALIGQPFDAPKWFHARPSVTAGHPYNGLASGGANLGPTHPALVEAVRARIDALRAEDPDNRAPIPVDLVTSSASGLDPDLSLAAVDWQIARVARVNGLTPAAVRALVEPQVRRPIAGVFGEARVNVLALNLALEAVVAKR
jgi:potassium-transporting ATPase KdpC subunit